MKEFVVSKTHIKDKTRRKTNRYIVETVKEALKNKAWEEMAHLASTSSRKYPSFNLGQIDRAAKDGDTIVIPGKVLSQGEVTKKIKICSLSISQQAKDKLKKSKTEYSTILDEIKSNTTAKGVQILR
jgi:large subunit ribosomal protein L18e